MGNQDPILGSKWYFGSGPDCPLLVPEKENRFLGIISGNEKTGKVIVVANTDCTLLVLDIKNSFWEFLKIFLGR